MSEMEIVAKWQSLSEKARKLELALFFNEVDCDYLIISSGGPAKRFTILGEVESWLDAVEWGRDNL